MKKTVLFVSLAVIFTMLLLTSKALAGKITICHNGNTISVSENAWPAHDSHGDSKGPCKIDAPPENTPVPEEPTDVPEEPTDVPEEPTGVPEEPTDVPVDETPEPGDPPQGGGNNPVPTNTPRITPTATPPTIFGIGQQTLATPEAFCSPLATCSTCCDLDQSEQELNRALAAEALAKRTLWETIADVIRESGIVPPLVLGTGD